MNSGSTKSVSSLVDVNFEGAKSHFFAGDCIQGTVNLSASADTIVRYVQAEVQCQAKAYYVHYIPSIDERPDFFESKPLSHQYLTTEPFVMFDARPKGGVVVSSPIQQLFAFQIPITADLPSSLTSRIATFKKEKCPMSVEYSIKFITFGLAGKVLNEKTFLLDIRSLYSYPNPEKPLKVTHTELTAGCCGASKKTFTFCCVTDRTVYGPGDRIRLSYWYNSRNAHFLKILSVVVKVEHTAKSLNLQSMISSETVVENACGVPTYGEVCHAHVDVPMNVVPEFTLVGAPHPLNHAYSLILTVVMDRGSLVLAVPVMFNSLSSAQLAQFPFSVIQKPLSRMASDAQALYATDPNPPALAGATGSGPVPLNSVGYASVPTSAI